MYGVTKAIIPWFLRGEPSTMFFLSKMSLVYHKKFTVARCFHSLSGQGTSVQIISHLWVSEWCHVTSISTMPCYWCMVSAMSLVMPYYHWKKQYFLKSSSILPPHNVWSDRSHYPMVLTRRTIHHVLPLRGFSGPWCTTKECRPFDTY